MDYSVVYKRLVKNASGRQRDEGASYEAHHIKPRCCGGSDEQHNLVLLTFREHYLAHMLLVKMHPDSKPLATALWMMTMMTERALPKLEETAVLDYRIANRLASIKKHRKTVISSYAYAFSKVEFMKHMVGHDVSDSTKKLISKNTKAAMQSKEVIAKCSSGSLHSKHYYDMKTLKAYKWFPGDPAIDESRFKWGRPHMPRSMKDKLSALKHSSRVMISSDDLEICIPVYRSAVKKMPAGWKEANKPYHTARQFKQFIADLKTALLSKDVLFNMMFCYNPMDITKKKRILNPAFFDVFGDCMAHWRDDSGDAIEKIV